jgi:ABC-2 type transport system permease protein
MVTARRSAGKAARSAMVWGCVFGLYVASSALAYAASYKTPLAREQLAATFGSNLGFNALFGPAHEIGTVAGFTAWRSLGVLGIVGGVWGLLAGTRLLRGEEDAGRWELLLVGQTTRRGATAKALVGLAAGLLTLWGVTATITIAVGRVGTVNICVGPSMFLALGLVSSAAVFLAAGALTSQLAPTRRQAAGYAAGALGVSYLLRMVADSGTGLDWLRWLSPLGWVEELRPLTFPQPLALVPIVALVAAMAGLAIHLAGVRDLGASVIADRSSAHPHTWLLAGPTGLAIRLTRGVLTAWGLSIALMALLMGLIAKSVGTALSVDAGDREAFAKLGFRGSGTEQYLAITFLLVALLVALVAAGQLSAARDEEAEGRVDHLLVRPVSRYRWLAGRLSHWVLDTSLFHQMAAAPAISPNWTSGAILVALGVAAAAVGAVAFRYRDLAGE